LFLAGFGEAELFRGCWPFKQSCHVSFWHGKFHFFYYTFLSD